MLCQKRTPVTIKDCQIQKNKFKNKLEGVLKQNTQFELSNIDIPNIKF